MAGENGGGGGNAPSSIRLAAAADIEPYTQGRLDQTCSLYAIVNALRLVAADLGKPLRWGDCHTLFRYGAVYLNQNSKLDRALLYGVKPKLFVGLAAELTFRAIRIIRVPLSAQQPFRKDDGVTIEAVIEIARFALRERRAVLVLLEGAYEHYTVICGLTPTRFQLFDSYGFHWVALAHCGVGDESPARHRIHARSLTVLGAWA